jgi:ABC-type nitrate/sulfonate/bicarbonate transport system substrate-binding protein
MRTRAEGKVTETMGKKTLSLFLSLAAAVSLTACGSPDGDSTTGSGSASGDSSQNSISFMLDWTANTNHIGVYAAEKLGYYKDAGINVSILPTSQSGAETAVETGVANVGFTTLSNVAAFDEQGSHLKFVFDLTQKQVARWCALKSRTDIKTPKDFDGKTFVTFGSAEQTAVLQQMIKTAGGTGKFDTATVGTSTFQTLTSGKGDFGGFYETWEGVEAKLEGPALNCFVASDWGVPGNPDQLGFAVNTSWEKNHKEALQKFIDATARGYAYALAHPQKAADILVEQAKDANLDSTLTRTSMETIAKGDYWGDTSAIAAASDDASTAADLAGLGVTNTDEAQEYMDFLWKNGVYKKDGKNPASPPSATTLATNSYINSEQK